MMMTLEQDPHLASGFANVTLLDRPADLEHMRARLLRGAARIPQLRRTVVDDPLRLAPPRWIDDPDFAIERHVRSHTLTGAGDLAEVVAVAMECCSYPYDLTHPLWEFVLIDGLADGRGAMVQRMHHTLTDGVGAVRMSEHFIDLERDAPIPPPIPFPEPEVVAPDRFGATLQAFDHTARRGLGAARRGITSTGELVAHPDRLGRLLRSTVGFTRAVVHEATAVDRRRSPLWTTRSLDRTLRFLRVPLDDIRRVAKAHGTSINNVFVAGAAGGAGAYHRACGIDVHELRMAMPVSTRPDRSEAGNSFGMARLLIPTGPAPLDRLGAVHERLDGVRGSATVSLAHQLAGPANLLPAALLVQATRMQVSTVDFTSSNVRGAPFPLYLAGSRIESNHPIGPLVGTAFNLTTLSYDGSLDMGLHIDRGAVEQPDLLVECIQAAFDELLAT